MHIFYHAYNSDLYMLSDQNNKYLVIGNLDLLTMGKGVGVGVSNSPGGFWSATSFSFAVGPV